MDFNMQSRIAEIIAIAIILISTLGGYYTGLVKTLFRIVRLVLMTLISLLLAPIIVALIPQTTYERFGMAYLISFLAAVVLLGVVSRLLGIIDHIPILKEVNRMAGALAGIVIGFFIVWLILIFIGTFQSMEWCGFVTSLVRESKFLMFVQGLNPIPRILDMLHFPTL